MTPTCVYLKQPIKEHHAFYSVSLVHGYGYAAISEEALSRIPLCERLQEQPENGLVIRHATCGEDFSSKAWGSFKQQGFAFALNEESASLYLPGLLQMLAQVCI